MPPGWGRGSLGSIWLATRLLLDDKGLIGID